MVNLIYKFHHNNNTYNFIGILSFIYLASCSSNSYDKYQVIDDDDFYLNTSPLIHLHVPYDMTLPTCNNSYNIPTNNNNANEPLDIRPPSILQNNLIPNCN